MSFKSWKFHCYMHVDVIFICIWCGIIPIFHSLTLWPKSDLGFSSDQYMPFKEMELILQYGGCLDERTTHCRWWGTKEMLEQCHNDEIVQRWLSYIAIHEDNHKNRIFDTEVWTRNIKNGSEVLCNWANLSLTCFFFF
jgi:hypothetical protein